MNNQSESKYQKRHRRTTQKRNQFFCIASGILVVLASLIVASRTVLESFRQKKESDQIKQIIRAKILQEHLLRVKEEGEQLTQTKIGRGQNNDKGNDDRTAMLTKEFEQLDADIQNNHHGGIRWIKPHLLKELPGKPRNLFLREAPKRKTFKRWPGAFSVQRQHTGPMTWEQEWKLLKGDKTRKVPKVDYIKLDYTFPEVLMNVPQTKGVYPPLEKLREIFARYPQDDLDHPPQPFIEKLLHFNYSNPIERAAAERFRNAELPFKVYDVPDLPTNKWTDDYVTQQFDGGFINSFTTVRTEGAAQESPNNFFAFFTPQGWNVATMGPPPTRNNDWTFQKWSDHAKYADHVALDFDQPHFYWQAGAPKAERYKPESEWSFITKDLPMMSSTTPTFFAFEPEEQKGIQCRFGERGVTAATHYDSGRNMVAMITGAKRYILAPPRECSKLGIVTARGNSIFRHSLLNLGHIGYLHTESGSSMSDEEQSWLELASKSEAIDTILKQGEVLYIPSHWFHYIISVQKSAQCNVRSGLEEQGTVEFGGLSDVRSCSDADPDPDPDADADADADVE